MRLALIGYLHGAGGAERQIILLANEMCLRGHEVHLVVLCECHSKYPIDPNVIFHDLTDAETKGSLKILNRYRAFRDEIKQIQPDVTINYNLQSAYFSLITGKKYCGKVLYSERGDPYDKEYSGILGFIRDITFKKVDALVFQSEGAKNFFNIDKKKKWIVIHNSVNVPQELFPIPEKRDNRIVTVGRLHPQKNPLLLIEAFSKIAANYPDVSLEFYGDGEMYAQLVKKVNDLNLTSQIHFNASRKDIFDCIRTARLFVLTSDYEGMPNALMEAMALGLPCLSTDCRPGGVRTLIKDGKNGMIIPMGDSVQLYQKMSYLLDNPLLAERMAVEARQISMTHTNKVIFDKWNDFLISL
jgi:glycosyltransferase involved in cell wall biosynthesis